MDTESKRNAALKCHHIAGLYFQEQEWYQSGLIRNWLQAE